MAQTVELARTTGGGVTELRAPGPDPLIGQHLLHYEVIEVIGQGGMSVVYRGHDERLHRDVAIKVLHPFLAEKPECRQRLAREARAVARLEHPHILKVFDFSGEPATLDEMPQTRDRVRGFAEGFIIAELVRGTTLRRFAEDHTLWRCPEIGVMVIWQVARALEHAHEHGVVHRDLKPENVMVRDDGCLKLMDFGIAQIADQKGLTITGTLLGSPAHMAPECIDGHPADERSDLFSLGTVLYWLCTGALPFEAHSPHALLKQIVEGNFAPVQQKSRLVSDDLAKLIGKALARRPEDRYPTAGAFVAALEELLTRSGLPPSADVLAGLLAHTEERMPQVQADVRAAFLARAARYVDEGAPARAIGCLNRVLAADNDDVDAIALLEKAQGGLVDEPTDPAAERPAGALISPPSTDASRFDGARDPARDSQPPTVIEPASASVSRVAQKAALVAAAVGLIAAAVAVSFRFDDTRTPSSGGDARAVVPPVDDGVSLEMDAVGRDRPAGPDAATAAALLLSPGVRDPRPAKNPDTKSPDARDPRAGRDPRDGRTKAQDPVPAVVTPMPALRTVEVAVTPFADILVDGSLVASGAKRINVPMTPGTHKVTFVHQAAMEMLREVVVPADGPVPEVTAELAPRPAFVTIDCNVPGALVSVGDIGGMTAQETQARPLLVEVNKKTFRTRQDLTVYKKGWVTFTEPVELLAGARFTRKVVLEPEPDGAAPPTP